MKAQHICVTAWVLGSLWKPIAGRHISMSSCRTWFACVVSYLRWEGPFSIFFGHVLAGIFTSFGLGAYEFPLTSISSLQMHLLGCPGYFVWNRATCICRCHGSGVTLQVWGSSESNGWSKNGKMRQASRSLRSLRPSVWLHGSSFFMVFPNTSSSAWRMTVWFCMVHWKPALRPLNSLSLRGNGACEHFALATSVLLRCDCVTDSEIQIVIIWQLHAALPGCSGCHNNMSQWHAHWMMCKEIVEQDEAVDCIAVVFQCLSLLESGSRFCICPALELNHRRLDLWHFHCPCSIGKIGRKDFGESFCQVFNWQKAVSRLIFWFIGHAVADPSDVPTYARVLRRLTRGEWMCMLSDKAYWFDLFPSHPNSFGLVSLEPSSPPGQLMVQRSPRIMESYPGAPV